MSTQHRPGTPSAAVINGVDVEAVAAAVQGCAGVSALDSGQFGEVESYLPGRRVPGVVVRDCLVLVGVRSRWGVRAADLFAQIASAVAPLIGRRWVEVAIGDIDDPPAPGRVPPPALEAMTKLLTLPFGYSGLIWALWPGRLGTAEETGVGRVRDGRHS
jgi:hypothetical protein